MYYLRYHKGDLENDCGSEASQCMAYVSADAHIYAIRICTDCNQYYPE